MPDALSLGFDTSAAHCAAAVVLGDRVLAMTEAAMARGQAEALMPLLGGVLADAGGGWRDVAVIGVGTGPGNFTGVRIAVAAARGLALGLGVPAVGVTRAAAMAHGAPGPGRTVWPGRGDGRFWQDWTDGVTPAGPLAEAADGVLPPGPPPLVPAHPLAVAIARIALARRHAPGPRPAPAYLRPPAAAPSREAGPVPLP